MFKVQEFPRNYVCNRWRRDVVPNYAASSFQVEQYTNPEAEKAKHIAREIMQLGEKLVNCLITDFDKLSAARDEMKGLVTNANQGRFKRPFTNKRDRFATVLGYKQPAEVTVRVPTGIRNKGRGSHKRIKSKKEQAISRLGKRDRKCLHCKVLGHDRRTCPILHPERAEELKKRNIAKGKKTKTKESSEDEEEMPDQDEQGGDANQDIDFFDGYSTDSEED
jgi:hypothetical protein